MRIRGTTAFYPIQLDEGREVPELIQYLRTGKFNHPEYGTFEIKPATLTEMIKNFNERVRGVDICFDYFHDSDKEASGWVEGLELREDGTQLWAKVRWTEAAKVKLAQRELRYFSPDFAFRWQDPESGKTFNNVIFGGGLTNRPFVKEMQAIVAAETKGESMGTELEQLKAKVVELEAANLKLSEDKAAAEKKCEELAAVPPPKADDSNSGEAGDEVASLKKANAELADQLSKLQAEHKKMLDEMQMAEKTAQFNVLLTEGKACAAQKDAFLKGDMAEYIKLAQPVNLEGKGSSSGESKDEKTFEERVAKLAEDKVKADPKLAKHEAISLAHKELRKK